jgi:hypothetical protein
LSPDSDRNHRSVDAELKDISYGQESQEGESRTEGEESQEKEVGRPHDRISNAAA